MKDWIPAHRGWIFFLLLLTAQTGLGQDPDVQVIPASGSAVRLKSGSNAVLSVRVRNMGLKVRSFRSTVDLPTGWKSLSHQTAYVVESLQSDVRLISLRIPSDAPARTYRVGYVVRDAGTDAPVGVSTFEVRIDPVYAVDLQILDAPRYVVEETVYQVLLVAANGGNTPIRLTLSAENSHETESKFDSSSFVMLPKASLTIPLKVVAPVAQGRRVEQVTEITAGVVEDSSLVRKLTATVSIIPRTADRRTPYVQFPIQATLRSTGDNDGNGLQGELSGYGSFSEKGGERLEFLVRTPEAQAKSDLGMLDEYKIRYQDRRFEVYAGDWNYSLSTLTELGRYAFGVGGRYSQDRWMMGAFANKSRLPGRSQKEQGAFATYRFAPKSEVSAQLLHRTDTSSSSIASLRGQTTIFQGTLVDLELAGGSSVSGGSTAISLRMSGNPRWMSYDARFIQADAKFTGYYRDIRTGSFNATIFGPKDIRFEVLARGQQRNLKADTLIPYAPDDFQVQLGVGYSGLATVSYRMSGEEDVRSLTKTSRRDNVIQGRISYPMSKMFLSGNIDAGMTEDRRLRRQSPYRRFAVSASAYPWVGHSITLNLEQTNDRNMFTGYSQERSTVGLTVNSMIMQNTQLFLNMSGSRSFAPNRQQSSYVDASIEHRFPFEHRVFLRARRIDYGSFGASTAYVAEYGIPVAIPVRRISDVGIVKGKLTDERGRGIENALVTLEGGATVSDKNGEFSFPPMVPGRYFLLVDRASIGLDRIPMVMLPLELQVVGGREEHLPLQVVKSATLSGSLRPFRLEQVMIGDSASIDLVPDSIQSPGTIQIEISNGQESLRRVVDNRGRFSFSDVRPGTWRLNATGIVLPENSSLDPSEMVLELSPGQNSEVSIRVMPRRKTLRIIQQGPVLQVAPTPTPIQTPGIMPRTPADTCVVLPVVTGIGFRVQESSWTSRSTANAHAGRIRAGLRLPAVVERAIVGRRARYRVFVGPFATMQAATAACQAMKKAFP